MYSFFIMLQADTQFLLTLSSQNFIFLYSGSILYRRGDSDLFQSSITKYSFLMYEDALDLWTYSHF